MSRVFCTFLAMLIVVLLANPQFSLSETGRESAQEFSAKGIDEHISKGIEAILKLQDKDGGWTYQGVVGKPIGYRVSATCFVCMALTKLAPSDDKAKEAVEKGLRFVLNSCDKNKEMSGDGLMKYDTRFWGQTYALALLVDVLKNGKDRKDREEITATIEKLIGILEKTAAKNGGWNYASRESICSFLTGPVLLNFLTVKEAGFKINDETIQKALDGLKKQKLESGAFVYSGLAKGKPPEKGTGAVPGAIARMSVAELTLLKYKAGDEADLEKAIQAFFEHWKEIKARHKQSGTHAGTYGIAPYYFFFGHYYTGLAIAALSNKDSRDKHYKKLFELFMETKEEDGGWNDRVFEPSKSYCTAKVILILSLMREHLSEKK